MLKKVSNKENVFMFFRDKLRHGPFPKLKTAIFIKIAKIIKNQISIIFLQYNLKSRCALREKIQKISFFLIRFLNF